MHSDDFVRDSFQFVDQDGGCCIILDVVDLDIGVNGGKQTFQTIAAGVHGETFMIRA